MAYRWHQNPNGNWECINGANGTPAEINRCKGTIGLPPYTPDPERVSMSPTIAVGKRSIGTGTNLGGGETPMTPTVASNSQKLSAWIYSPMIWLATILIYLVFFRK